MAARKRRTVKDDKQPMEEQARERVEAEDGPRERITLRPKQRPEVEGQSGTEDPRAEAQRRAGECYREVEQVLRRYRCHAMAQVTHEPVGQDGSKVLTSATWGIVPLPLPQE